MNVTEIKKLNNELENKSVNKILSHVLKKYKNKITFATSLGAEDQIITEIIYNLKLPVKIFMLDTGRLFPQTYDLLDRTNKKYKINCRTIESMHQP